MNDRLRHRGPDDEGYWFIDSHGTTVLARGDESNEKISHLPHIKSLQATASLALAHRRLSIIDLTVSGHQPMVAGDLSLVFNGEIYNYREMRRQLSEYWDFKTNTDTEIILSAYHRWGEKCFEYLDGMWAIALVDRSNNCLYLSRDRVGEKPLYFAEHEGRLFFASEIKAIVGNGLIDFEPDENSVNRYLLCSIIRNELDRRSTMFQGIKEILPAHYYKINLTNLNTEIKSYWSLPEENIELAGDSRLLSEQARIIIDDSINKRLHADVPIAVALSGGLDSSIIAAATKQQFGANRVTAYSCRANPMDEDTKCAIKVADKLRIDLRWVEQPAQETWELLPEIIWHYDEPPKDLGGSSGGGHHLYRAIASDGFKVVLDGLGADELLAGYPGYFGPFFMIEYLKRLAIRQAYLEGSAWMHNEGYAAAWLFRKTLFQIFGGTPLAKIFSAYKKRISNNMKLTHELIVDADLLRKTFEGNLTQRPGLSLTSAKKFFIYRSAFQCFLHHVDRNSMSASIEGRMPFLSKDFMEFAMKLPVKAQLSDGFNKNILRTAYEDLLPKEVSKRKKKQGFTTPTGDWMNHARENILDQITASDYATSIFNRKELVKLIEKIDFKTADIETQSFIWRIYACAVWFDVFKSYTKE